MKRPPRSVTRVMSLGFVSLVGGCEGPHTVQIRESPDVQPLTVLSTIRGKDFYASGLVSAVNCKLLVAGATWGLTVEVDIASGESRLLGQIPTQAHETRLESSPEGRILAWSQDSHVLGWIESSNATFRPISLPVHPWVGAAVGPTLPLANGRIAVAPIGGRPNVRAPRPWLTAPLVYVLNEDGTVVRTVGEVPDAGGYYLSAARSQVRMGRHRDTLLVVRLFDATVFRFPLRESADSNVTTSRLLLPQYFRSPQPTEDVWEAPWLLNGSQPRIYQVPQLAEAAFASDGRLFVIRNGGANWDRSDSPLAKRMYKTAGRWKVTRRWLEVYDIDGERLDAYSLPGDEATRITADDLGRLFIWHGDGSISIVNDPTSAPVNACGSMPTTIDIPFVDSPHQTPLRTIAPAN